MCVLLRIIFFLEFSIFFFRKYVACIPNDCVINPKGFVTQIPKAKLRV
jgi:hypothetical protein